MDQFDAEFDRLFEQHFARLFRYLDRSLGDAQLAADLAQEAFVRLFDRGEMPDEPIAWLITVAANLLRDDKRRTTRRLRLLARAPDDVPHATAPPDPAAAIDQAERRDQVRAALARLAPRDRDALLLRHSGYSYREIALALGITETGVGTVLLRAGASFRKAYQELHGDPD
jgi:RNA polymerase sigma-70 factor (ECF subfamily)